MKWIIVIPLLFALVVCAFYFPIKWIARKWKTGKARKAIFTVIYIVIVSPALYLLVFVTSYTTALYYPNEKFDRDKWAADIEMRFVMSKDIRSSKMLIGLTREEVIGILGNDFGEHKNIITYYLGYATANIDPDVLEIYFEDGKVVRVSQRTT